MELSVSHQLFVVICMFLCGGITGIIFDLFRGFRRCVKSASGVIVAQDLLLWAAELIVVYYTAFKVNNAAIRAYEGVALVCGAAIYFVTVSEYTVRGVCKATVFALKISDALLFPLRKMLNFVTMPLKRMASYAEKKISATKNKLKKFAIEKKKKIKAVIKVKKRKK